MDVARERIQGRGRLVLSKFPRSAVWSGACTLGPAMLIAIVTRSGLFRAKLMDGLTEGKSLPVGHAGREGFWFAAAPLPKFRGTLQGWTKSLLGARDPADLARALMTLDLWEHRGLSRRDLDSRQCLLAAAMPAFLSDADALVFPAESLGGLDALDLHRILRLARERAAEGVVVFFETDDLGLAVNCDAVIVGSDQGLAYAGSLEDLVAQSIHEVQFRTESESSVRAMVDPFAIRIEVGQGEVRAWAPRGQELAARLLALGYGDIEFVVVRPPTFESVVVSLMAGGNEP